MAVDPYAMCPCGSGKKLKFCCSDLVGDIEKIHRMVEGDQPRAALQHAEQTLKKRPGRPSLLDLKAMLEITLGKMNEARETVALLLESDPENPAAHAQQAILLCAEEDGVAAIEPLQRALALIEDNMPRRVLEAIGAVGHTLLIEGNITAARAHLWLYQGIAGREDTRALELLTRMNQVSSLPLLLRDHLYMHEAPAGHPAEDQHNYAQALAARGQWGPASAVFDKLCADHPDVATLHYNRALVYGWLGELETFAAGLREYAKRDPDSEDAVEAEAIAQLVDPNVEEPRIDVVKLVYPLLDEEEATARLTRDARYAQTPFDPQDSDEQSGPPPRAVYVYLDRPLPTTGEGLTWDQTPRIIGPISQYSRQTNRSERLELVIAKDAAFDDARSQLEQHLNGVVGVAEEEEIGSTDAPTEALRSHLRFPQDTPPAVRRDVMRKETTAAITEHWPNAPLAALGGKTALEAAGNSELDLALRAAVLLLEQNAQSFFRRGAIAELRQKLGLAEPAAIDSSTVDYDRLPLGRATRVDLSSVTDEDLVRLYRRATLAGAATALRHAAQEVIRRPKVEGNLDVDDAYQRVISLTEDPAESFAALDKARARAEEGGKSTAQWDLLELELRIVEGDTERSQSLLQHINTDHMQEPGVAEHLYELFYQLGAIPPDGQMAPPDEAVQTAQPLATAAASEPGRIWTPDSDRPDGDEKKLWTPS